MSSDQNDTSNDMQIDQDQNQDAAPEPGTSAPAATNSAATSSEDPAVMRERVRRMKRARRAVDAYVNNLLYDMMCRSGVEIPREELAQGFEDYCMMNNTGRFRVPDHLRSWWNLDDRKRRHGGPSEE